MERPVVTNKDDLIKQLIEIVTKLEVRVALLERKQPVGFKPNCLEWLNAGSIPAPSISFDDFINKCLSIVPNHLYTVFDSNLIMGISDTIKETIETCGNETVPIRKGPSKSNEFYIYKSDEQWHIISTEQLNDVFEKLRNQFIAVFRDNWVTPNQDKINAEERYQQQYYNNFIKIMGGKNCTDYNTRQERLRKNLFQLLK